MALPDQESDADTQMATGKKQTCPKNFCCRSVVSIVIQPTHRAFQSACSRDVWRIKLQTWPVRPADNDDDKDNY